MALSYIDFLIERKDFFLQLLLEHVLISGASITIAMIVGLFISILICEFKRNKKWVMSVINVVYTIPSISLLGFLIPFSGIGNITAIIALTIYALLPMVRNTCTGINNIDNDLLESAKCMGGNQWQILWKIKIPLAMPMIMAGIRNMVTMTIALAGIASFIGAGGLGVAIYRGITTNNTKMTIIGSLLIALLAIVMDFILGKIELNLKRHKTQITLKQRIFKPHHKSYNLIIIGLIVAIITGYLSINNYSKQIIRIATKPMTEQNIIGEMLKILIERDTNLKVKLIHSIGGGTANIQPAMMQGDLDIYPEYTGTGWNMVLKKEDTYHELLFQDLQKAYQANFNMSWLGMYGFNNTYGIAVRKEIADKYHLKTYSDLSAVSNLLIFGAEYDFFERKDGYDALREKYGYHFKKTIDLDIGLKYQAMQQNKIDAMTIFTTDGQLSISNITILIDDKHIYPSYLIGNVVRNEILKRHPELTNIFTKITGKISDSDMAKMNYAVEMLGKSATEVAMDFLKSTHLIRSKNE